MADPAVDPSTFSSQLLLLPPPPPPVEPASVDFLPSYQRPALRIKSEYDSDRSSFFHSVSCKLLDGFAKLRLTFLNDRTGAVISPQVGFLSRNFSVFYDLDSRDALVKVSLDVGNRLHFRASHDVKEAEGEVAMVASPLDPSYKLEISSPIPLSGPPNASIRFPLGEVVLANRDMEETNTLSVNAVLKGNVMNGKLTAFAGADETGLRYSYKDDEMTFIPSVSLPSNFSLAFKRRFGPLDKLSYWYHFSSNYWSTVYRRNIGKDLKFKAGYDSAVRLAWASLWVGDEKGKTKMAPMKMKVQLMLQVPQDNIALPVLLFKVKKRWDF